MMTREKAREFAARWLPAWTGNRPEALALFYSPDTFYSDPGIPEGVQGREALTEYFRKLLAENPAWVWMQTDSVPMERGFVNKWKAMIPVGAKTLSVTGVCLVQFDKIGLIARNEVYFDRTQLVGEIMAFKNRAATTRI